MNKDRLVVAALVGWLFAGVLSAAPQFVASPSSRYSHAMAYDSQREVAVLFGGNSNTNWPSGALDDTWEWDGHAWTQRFPANKPIPIGHGAMAYDSSRGVCVYFGGLVSQSPVQGSSETWEWDGNDWTQRVNVGSPGGRYHHSMVYDSVRQVVVLFGGWNGSDLGDTWEYDGVAWVNRNVVGPDPRRSHDMAYQASTGKTILFGGYDGARLSDTWAWDGIGWTQLAPSTVPQARDHHALCYHAGLDRVVMFGGSAGSAVGRNDTWVWDGADWTETIPTVRPAARYWVMEQMVYDARHGECVLFGGIEGSQAIGDTWCFGGTDWRPKLDYVTSPVNGNRYALTPPMTWQEAEDLAVLEGGHLATIRSLSEEAWIDQKYGVGNAWLGLTYQSSSWGWTSGAPLTFTSWCQAPSSPGNNTSGLRWGGCGGDWAPEDPARPDVPGIIEILGGPVSEVTASTASSVTPQPWRANQVAPLMTGGAISFGGETASGPWAFTYQWTNSGWNKQFSVLNPMPRTGHTLTLDEVNQSNVLFGGVNPAGTKLAETWTYQGGQWTYLTPATAPSARSEHAMTFDPVAGLGVLIGGEDATGTALADMWTWDGTDWAALTPATLPPARLGHGLAYDRYRSRLVLFGGTDGASRLNDIWEWDGTDWSPITPAQPNGVAYGPSGRDGFVMEYDPRSERVVVIGGETDVGCVDDVWSWDGVGWTRHFPTGASTLPSPRKDAASFVDAVTGALRLVGGGCGSEFSDELWEFQLPVFSRSAVIGVGCAGSNGVPTLSIASGEPVLGTSVDFLYTNALSSPFVTPAVVAVGFSQDVYQGLPLPLPLAVIGLPGCALYHSNDLSFSVGVAPNTAQFTWTLPIPTSTSYLGQEWFVQGLHLEFPGSGNWAAMSNAVGIRIGDQ